MKLCIHNHELTPDNLGTVICHTKAGRQYVQKFCKQCRRNSSKRFYDKHGRPSRKYKKRPSDEVRWAEPPPRLRCPSCAATAETKSGIREHERRFHSTWNEGSLSG